MKPARRRWEGVLLLVLFVSLFVTGLGSMGFVDYDEAAYAETARQMYRTGDLLISRVEGEHFFEKPPLLYWWIAAGYELLGVNEWGGRVPSALASVATILLVWFFVRRSGRPGAALPAALAFGLSYNAFALARTALTDAPLTLLMTLVMVTAYGMVTRPGRAAWSSCLLLGVSGGLAVLAKGPVGVVLPGATLFVFLLIRGNLSEGLRRLGLVRSLSIATIVAAPWFIAMAVRFGPEFLDVFFIEHNVMRFVKPKEGHGGPPVYYLAVLLVGFFPWVTLLPGAAARAWPRRGSGSTEAGDARDLDRRDDLPLFLLVWAFVVLAFFSVSGTKLPQYIAPAYPALAILVGLRIDDLRGAADPARRLRWPLRALAAVSVVLGGALLASPWFLNLAREMLPAEKTASSPVFAEGFHMPPGLLVLGAAMIAFGLGVVGFARLRPARAPVAIAAGFLGLLGLTILAGRGVDEALQRPLRELSREAGRLISPGEPVHVFSLRRMPSVGFYSDHGYRPVLHDRKETMRRLVDRGLPFAAIAPRSDRKRFRNIQGIRVVREEGGYVLFTRAK